MGAECRGFKSLYPDMEFDTDFVSEVAVGDTVTRLLAGVMPMRLKVTAIDEFIHCGEWKFDRTYGIEVDEYLDASPESGKVISYIIRPR